MLSASQGSPHPEFADLADSWELALRADGYAPTTVRAYRLALAQFAAWLAEADPDVGPLEVARDHVRGWVVNARETRSSSTARAWFPAVRHFFRFLVAEGEIATDPTAGLRTPPPNEQTTAVLTVEQVKALLAACTGADFTAKRDRAIILLFLDGGLRLSELAGLAVADVDLRERLVYVVGKGSGRSGPRRRVVPVGVKTAQALDRYLRERRRHPYAHASALWLGGRGRGPITADGIDAVVKRRSAAAGVEAHPHMLRHTWASAFRSAGGSEGDLMTLGGWRNRAMLDRYGRADAADRAREAYRRLSFGDRLT